MKALKELRNLLVLAGLGVAAYYVLLDDEARSKAETTIRDVREKICALIEKVDSLQGTTVEDDRLEQVRQALDARWARIGY